MAKRQYVVQAMPAVDGLEILAEPPPRRLYRPGETVELDDAVSDVVGLVARGIVKEMKPAEKTAKGE